MKLFIKKREKRKEGTQKRENKKGRWRQKRRRKREERERQANRLGNTTVTDDTTIPLIHEGLAPGPSLDTNINRCSGPLVQNDVVFPYNCSYIYFTSSPYYLTQYKHYINSCLGAVNPNFAFATFGTYFQSGGGWLCRYRTMVRGPNCIWYAIKCYIMVC